jgi:hypothetical protein
MFTLEPLRFRGHSYDPRMLAAPLETLVLRAALARAARPSNEAALALVLLTDSEGVLEDQRRRVHSTASSAGPLGRVCSCGLVMGDLDPVAATGHLDTVTWQPTDVLVLVTSAGDGRERFAVVCQGCGWAAAATSADDADSAGDAHDCASETRDAATHATLRAHLHP